MLYKEKMRTPIAIGRARLLLTIAVLSGVNAMAAEQWTPIETTTENLAFSIDVASVQRKGETVTFRERLVFTNPEQRDAVSGKLIKAKHALRVMRCNAKTQGVKSGTLVDEYGRAIETVSIEDRLIHWLPIPVGSVAERQFDLVCEPKAATKPAAPR
jgi:hypothetical protein